MAMDAAVQGERAAAPLAADWVVFSCEAHRFGLPVQRVRKIVAGRGAARLPGCGPAVLGLVSVRGRIVTAFDFGALMGLRPSAESDEHWLLLLEHGEQLVGIAVDEVVAMTAADSDAAAGSPGARSDTLPVARDALRALDVSRADVLGIGAVNERPFVAVDPDPILARLLV